MAKKRLKIVIVFMLLAILLVFAVAVVPFISSKTGTEGNSKIDSRVLTQVQQTDQARVIIEFKNSSQSNFPFGLFGKNTDAMAAKKSLENLLGKNVKHDFGDMISATISQQDILNLENNPNVESVQLVGVKHVLDPVSNSLINANNTWNLQDGGINITGQGETACIIDTGTDFNHPDLKGKNLTCIIDCISGSCAENCSAIDDNGHGTHVAGIIAANGSIQGVAPGANLVSVKACNSSGICSDDDILAGLDWCISNRLAYNISVISMSLGGGLYNSYCDNITTYEGNSTDNGLFSSKIDAAVSDNISVIVASGNDGNTTAIDSPACIKNSISVGAVYSANFGGLSWGSPTTCTDYTTAADQITCFTNRNPFLDLLAPGALINSTWNNGGYQQEGGTSMATPHVAGAFLLAYQIGELEGKEFTPSNIENAFNETGKQIYDNASGLNFSRINVYQGIISLDSIPPSVYLSSPINNTVEIPKNTTFSCNATDDLPLKNLTLQIWNSTSLYYTNTTNATSNSLNISSYLNLTYGDYLWNCIGYDNNSNKAYAISNFSIKITHPTYVTLSYPSDRSYFNSSSANFTCTQNTTNSLANSTFFFWNSTALVYNATMNISGASNQTTFNYIPSLDGNYSWNCKAYDNVSNSSMATSNFTVTYDNTAPNITIISPEDGVSYTGSTDVNFEYNVSENNPDECSLILNGATESTNSSINTSVTNEFTDTLSPGSYNWIISCSDLAGNSNETTNRSITINTAQTVSSGSTGGGGGGIYIPPLETITISNNELQQGASREITQGSKILFSVNNDNHTILLESITNATVTLTVSSNPINISLGINETKKLDLNSDNIYDLEIRLNSIIGNQADITITEISEAIPTRQVLGNESNNSETKTTGKGNNFSLDNIILILSFILIIFLIIFSLVNKKKKRNRKRPARK